MARPNRGAGTAGPKRPGSINGREHYGDGGSKKKPK